MSTGPAASPMGTGIAGLLRAHGFERVAGVDEAGRGALAGPLVAAAVVLPPGWAPEGLADSKLLTAGDRERLYVEILAGADAVGICRLRPATVDRVGLQPANIRALRGALDTVRPATDYALIDGRWSLQPDLPCLQVVKGDQVCAPVSAASIVAKVARDRVMVRLHERYPAYGFARNKGYGVPEHRSALAEHGACPVHRRCFAPVGQLSLQPAPRQRT